MESVWKELKRRNVFRVGAAYLLVAWLVLQVIETVLPTFGAPPWIARTLMFLVFLGFPLALILAWAFDLTPEGIKRTASVNPDQSIMPHTGQKLNTMIVAGLSIILLVVIIDAYVFDDPVVGNEAPATAGTPDATAAAAQAAELEKTVAVLPFNNLSSDPEQDYFSDGLAEEILNKLAQVRDLQVAARTSSFYYKGRSEDMRLIGAQLGVNFILEGSVRKSADQLRITAQLIQADSGFQLWSKIFEQRQLEDVFAIQDEIAAAVTTALRVTLRTDEFALPGSTRNVEAYEHYLRGVALAKLGGTNTETVFWQDTVDEFLQAVTLDPDYARAWYELYRAYATQSGYVPQERRAELWAKAGEALATATSLAPDMSELLVLQVNQLYGEGKLLEVENLLQELVKTQRDTQVGGSRLYSFFLLSVGRVREALPYAEQASRLDPLSSGAYYDLATAHYLLGQLDAAQQVMERGLASTVEGRGGYLPAIAWAIAYERGGKEGWSSLVLSQIDPESTNVVDLWNKRTSTILAMEDTAAAAEALRAIATDPATPVLFKASLAGFAGMLGEDALAVEFLNTFDSRQLWNSWQSGMRQQTGFKDYVFRAGLLRYWRASGEWGDYCRPLPETENDFECF